MSNPTNERPLGAKDAPAASAQTVAWACFPCEIRREYPADKLENHFRVRIDYEDHMATHHGVRLERSARETLAELGLERARALDTKIEAARNADEVEA